MIRRNEVNTEKQNKTTKTCRTSSITLWILLFHLFFVVSFFLNNVSLFPFILPLNFPWISFSFVLPIWFCLFSSASWTRMKKKQWRKPKAHTINIHKKNNTRKHSRTQSCFIWKCDWADTVYYMYAYLCVCVCTQLTPVRLFVFIYYGIEK